MTSKDITINDISITVHSDGSISKPDSRFKDGRIQRNFGYEDDRGYIKVNIGKGVFKMHRLVAQAFLSDFLDFPTVDHIDGDKANNGISNLRMATDKFQAQAHQNKRSGCSSKYRGVSWNKNAKRWVVSCVINGKAKHLGSFGDEREAAIARDTYAFSHGFPFEGLNFPENYS